jgi:DNA mismatch repair protein MutL
VNVHPAKREVRFRDPNAVREAVVDAVRRTLESERTAWQERFRAPVARPSQAEESKPDKADLDQPGGIADPTLQPAPTARTPSSPDLPHLEPDFTLRGQRSVEFVRGSGEPLTGSGEPLSEPASGPLGRQAGGSAFPSQSPNRQGNRETPQAFQIIGVLNKLYILMENADGLVLVDQHAAHERILFEELRRRMEEQGVPSQRLLMPQTFDLAPRDAEWIERNLSVLQKMGIGMEGFGPNTFKVDSLPAFVSAPDAVQFIQSVIDELKSASNSSSPLRLGEDMIAKTVCRHAVKANDPLRYPELEKLIRDLLDCELPYCCPHGRPTMIQISLAELEKKFGRKV